MNKIPLTIKNLKRLPQIFFLLRKAAARYKVPSASIILRAAFLWRTRQFSPEEAYQLGLLNPNLSDSELVHYTSRKKMTAIQRAINPQSWEFLTEDKSIFYKYCMATGIPVPVLYAILFKKAPGWTCNGPSPASRDAWIRFLGEQLPAAFVVKPARGVYGQGVNAFRRSGSGFIDALGRPCKAQEIYEACASDPQFDCYVIQELLRSHRELVRLSGTPSLQTARIVSCVDGDGRCQLLYSSFKAIVGSNIIDNHAGGLTGNLSVEVCLDTGSLNQAVKIALDGSGIQTFSRHPATGLPFEGFKLPFWDEARRMVSEAALKFLPIRTIGWDVALTPDGPVIVEGNMWWDPFNVHKCMDSVLDKLL